MKTKHLNAIHAPGSSVCDPNWGVLSDLFRGKIVTSIWVIKRSRMEEAGR